MDDEIGVIYGLELQTRALCAQSAETEIKRFLIGTQSLRSNNEVHLIEYDDETNSLSKCIYQHDIGEIWHINSSPNNKQLFLTCYNKNDSGNNFSMKCTLWNINDNQQMSIAGDDSAHYPLKQICDLPVNCALNAIFEPSTSNNIISLSENSISYFDCNNDSARLISSASLEAKGQPKFTNCRWNPHHNYTQIATCNDTAVRGWDLRSMNQTYVIENAHNQLVRDMDYNPNKQYYLVTCGDDCKTKFWDIRKTNECLKSLTNHSHWIWSVRYNNFHDQLILTCSSDTRVMLSSIPSLSSEPYGNTTIDDEINDSTNSANEPKQMEEDRVVKVYEEHEDSVYTVEWSCVDPWIFASLSYDGRFVINKVPKADKFKIIL